MKSKGAFLAMAAMLAATSNPNFTNKDPYPELNDKPKIEPDPIEVGKEALYTVCPNGCKTYFFNSSGEFTNGSMRKDECVFVCHASNDKNAIKKFNKFKPF